MKFEISLFWPQKAIRILISIEKKGDIILMIIYLIFYQNCSFLSTHVDTRSRNGDFSLSSVESSRCAANRQTRFWKLKLKSNKSLDLRNLYPNMVVFGLELLILFEANFEYELENINFQNIWFFSLNPHRAFCMHAKGRQQRRRSLHFIIFGLRKLSDY